MTSATTTIPFARALPYLLLELFLQTKPHQHVYKRPGVLALKKEFSMTL